MKVKKSIFVSVAIRLTVISVCLFFVFFMYISSERFGRIPPLIEAVGNVDEKKIKMLINRGVNLDVTDSKGNTALHYAVQNGDVPESIGIIMLLVKNYANVRARNDGGQTPLHLVDFIDDRGLRMEVISTLIKSGANINAKTNRGYTLLDRLVEARDQGSLEELIKQWWPVITVDTLKKAKKRADEFIFSEISTLLKKSIKKMIGVHDRIQAKNGLTSLMLAVIRGNKKMVVEFIQKRSVLKNERSQDMFKYSALHFAVLYRAISLLETLLQKNANSTVESKNGDTPLHLVAYIKNDTQAKRSAGLLLNYGANINQKNNAGNTILHIAVKRNNVPLVKYLINYFSTDINLAIKNSSGMTPVSLAEKLERKDIVHLFNELKEARQTSLNPAQKSL